MKETVTMSAKISTTYPRTLFLLWGWCTFGLYAQTPSSLTAVLVARAGVVGDIAAIAFGVAYIMLILDWLVNDVMPPRFHMSLTRDYRWFFVCVMATVYFLFGAISLLPNSPIAGAWVLQTTYFGVAIWALSFAWRAKMDRYQAKMAAIAGQKDAACGT